MTALIDAETAARVLAEIIAPRVDPTWWPARACACTGRHACGMCTAGHHDQCWGRVDQDETVLLGPGRLPGDQERARVWLTDRVCGHPCPCTVCRPPQAALFEVMT